jgi:hypothetical protein
MALEGAAGLGVCPSHPKRSDAGARGRVFIRSKIPLLQYELQICSVSETITSVGNQSRHQK